MTDKELPGVLHFPSRILGQAGAEGRNPAANCSALGCNQPATTAIDLWDYDSDCPMGKKHFCKEHAPDHNAHILERLHGVPANIGDVDALNEEGDPNIYAGPDSPNAIVGARMKPRLAP